MNELVDKIRQGDRRSLARAMSLTGPTGRSQPALEDCLRRLTGQVPWWGFTGPPGVGKSTLIDALLGLLRERGRQIGVVAIDPTSPVSSGAVLGDRVRMMRHAVDGGVFIRSLATHRREGGLSDATLHCARLLELAAYDPVLIETVGVGQNEIEIESVADICVVVLGPGYGDNIQLIKAGLLEIADVVVINKCDLPESNRLLKEIREELSQPAASTGTQPSDQSTEGTPGDATHPSRGVEIIGLEAKSGLGVDQLLEKLLELDRNARAPDQRAHREERRVQGELRRCAVSAYEQALEQALAGPAVKELITQLKRGETSLDAVVSQLAAHAVANVPSQTTNEERKPSA